MKASALHEAVKLFADRHKYKIVELSENWVIKFGDDRSSRFVIGYSLDINTQATADIALDKVATYKLLDAAKIPAVEHVWLGLERAYELDKAAVRDFFAKHNSVVVKPLEGGHGRNVARFDDADQAIGFMAKSDDFAWTASPFVEVATEVRVVVFDHKIHLAYEKYDPAEVDGLKLFNLSRGARAKRLSVNNLPESLRKLALESMLAIGLRLGAVDIVIDKNGNPRILEINSSFSLEHFAGISSDARTDVIEFYQHALEAS